MNLISAIRWRRFPSPTSPHSGGLTLIENKSLGGLLTCRMEPIWLVDHHH